MDHGFRADLMPYAKFLRDEKALKTYEGVIAEKRVEVFKGSHATKALLSKVAEKRFPNIAGEQDCHNILQEMLDNGLFLKVVSINNTRFLQPDTSRIWTDDGLYAWVYEGSQLLTVLMGLGILCLIFIIFLYPLWPARLRLVSWYVLMLAVAFLGFILVTSVVRIILFAITYFTLKPGIWLFPKLFDEEAGFIDSFIPLWDWHKPSSDY